MSVCLEARNLKVRSLDVDLLEITWEIEPTMEDIFDFSFQLTRSEGAEGPYDVLTPEMDDRYIFIDNQITRGHDHRQYFYRLVIKHKASGDTKEFGPASHELISLPGSSADI